MREERVKYLFSLTRSLTIAVHFVYIKVGSGLLFFVFFFFTLHQFYFVNFTSWGEGRLVNLCKYYAVYLEY